MSEQQSNGKPQTLTVVVIGNGAFGTAMAMVAARNDHNVIVFARNNDIVAGINDKHRNPSYFSDIDLPANLTATSDVESALASADLVILALPCQIVSRIDVLVPAI
jgi:glycerol-3-phosphate dehydrogenase (NAD(P)+)